MSWEIQSSWGSVWVIRVGLVLIQVKTENTHNAFLCYVFVVYDRNEQVCIFWETFMLILSPLELFVLLSQ